MNDVGVRKTLRIARSSVGFSDEENFPESSEAEQFCAAWCRFCGKRFGVEVLRCHEKWCENTSRSRASQPSTITSLNPDDVSSDEEERDREERNENKNQCNDKTLKSYSDFETDRHGNSPKSQNSLPPAPPPLPPVKFQYNGIKSPRSSERRAYSTADVHESGRRKAHVKSFREKPVESTKPRVSPRSKSYLDPTAPKSKIYQPCLTQATMAELSNRLSSVSQLEMDDNGMHGNECNTSNQNHQVGNATGVWRPDQQRAQQYPPTGFHYDRSPPIIDYRTRSPTFSEQSFRSQPMYGSPEVNPTQSKSATMADPNPANSWQKLAQASNLISSWRQLERQSRNHVSNRPARNWRNVANQGEQPRYSPTDLSPEHHRQSVPTMRSPPRIDVPQPTTLIQEAQSPRRSVSPKDISPLRHIQIPPELDEQSGLPPSQLRQALEVIKRRESLMNVGMMQKCRHQIEIRQQEQEHRRRQQLMTRQNWAQRRLQSNETQTLQRFQPQPVLQLEQSIPQPPRVFAEPPKPLQEQRAVRVIQNKKWVKDIATGKWILAAFIVEEPPPEPVCRTVVQTDSHNISPIAVARKLERRSPPSHNSARHSEVHPMAYSHRHRRTHSPRDEYSCKHSCRHREGHHGDFHHSSHASQAATKTEKKMNIAVKLAKEALTWIRGSS